MSYFEDYARIHHHAPSYQELHEEFTRLQDELRDPVELAQEQIRRLRIQLAEAQKKSEPAPKLAKTCTHLLENGQYCASLAVSDREFCAYHLHHRGRRLKMARARAHHQGWCLQLPPLEDLYSVQVGIDRVLDALLHAQLDRQVGGLVLYGLQQAATNLSRPDEVWEQSSRFQSREQLALPGFEAEFGLPPGFDLNTPPEVAFPETEVGAVSEERANLMEVTPLDIELMELQQREGPEAVARRLKQAEQAEDRRYKKAQAQLAHARYVVRADAQNAAREARFVVRSEAAVAAAEAEEKAAAAKLASSAAGKEERAASSGAGKEAGAASSAAGKEEGAASSAAAGAPPVTASLADRVGAGPVIRKEPQPAATGAEALSGGAEAGFVGVKSK